MDQSYQERERRSVSVRSFGSLLSSETVGASPRAEQDTAAHVSDLHFVFFSKAFWTLRRSFSRIEYYRGMNVLTRSLKQGT